MVVKLEKAEFDTISVGHLDELEGDEKLREMSEAFTSASWPDGPLTFRDAASQWIASLSFSGSGLDVSAHR